MKYLILIILLAFAIPAHPFGFEGNSTPGIKAGTGIVIGADGTISATGVALYEGVVSFSNISTAIRGRYENVGAVDTSTYSSFLSTNTNALGTKLNSSVFTSYTSSNKYIMEGKVFKLGYNSTSPITDIEMTVTKPSDKYVFTISRLSGDIEFYYNGAEVICPSPIVLTSDYTSLASNQLYFVYWNSNSCIPTMSTTPFDLDIHAPVATVFWNGSIAAITPELHNARRDVSFHKWAHFTIGSRISGGSDFAIVSPSSGSPNVANFSGGLLYDEDLIHSISNQSKVRVWSQSGTAGAWTFQDPSSTAVFNTTTNSAAYVNDSNVLTDVPINGYINMWFYVSPDKDSHIYGVIEKVSSPYTTIAAARAITPPNLSEFGGNKEMKIIYRVIYKGDNSWQETTDYRTTSSLPSGGAGATSASAVIYIPTSPVTGTTVQSALDQIITGSIKLNGGTLGSTDSCTVGTVVWDTDYMYLCVGTNTVKRIPLIGGY